MEPSMDRTPIRGDKNDMFDAQGNPRTLRTLHDGSVVNMSDTEYKEEIEATKEDLLKSHE